MASSPEVPITCAACFLWSFVKCFARGLLLYVSYHFLPKDVCTCRSEVDVKLCLNAGLQRNKMCPVYLSRSKFGHGVAYSLQRSTQNSFCPLRHDYRLASPFYLLCAKLVTSLCFCNFVFWEQVTSLVWSNKEEWIAFHLFFNLFCLIRGGEVGLGLTAFPGRNLAHGPSAGKGFSFLALVPHFRHGMKKI